MRLCALSFRLSSARDDAVVDGSTQRTPSGDHRKPAMAASSECRAEAGTFAPIVDRAKCEGKAECQEVCPFRVFEVRRIDDADFAKLGALAKLKNLVHGRKTAYTPLASACQACGKCVEACPEKAIKLARVSA